MLGKAFIFAGTKLRIIRSDGASKYVKLTAWLETVHNVHHQFSNPDEQHQNGLAEKFGDLIGKGAWAMLLQSNLGTEF